MSWRPGQTSPMGDEGHCSWGEKDTGADRVRKGTEGRKDNNDRKEGSEEELNMQPGASSKFE